MTERGSVSADAVRAALALRSVIDQARRLVHRLARAAEVLHAADELTGAERAVLVELAEEGARTVPEMARARPVTRQHIQSIVNPLAARGLVEFVDNPRHRRSKLVRITEAGGALVGTLRRREGRIVAALVPRLDAAALETTADTLIELGRMFDGDITELAGPGAMPVGSRESAGQMGR